MNCFVPLICQPSPVASARVRNDAASDPDSGSVSANAPIASPRASGGTNRARCSSVPNVRIGRVAALVCTATVTPTPASARESSSSTRMYETKSAPAPPYSSGTQTPISPSSLSFGRRLREKPCSRSQVAAWGSISVRATSRASAWISRWSAESSKSTGLTVVVEPAAGLAAQPPRLHVLPQQRARRVLRIAEPFVQHLHDGDAGVEADQVGQGERADRVVEAE